MGKRTCTCEDSGECGYCPSIAVRATQQGVLNATSGGNSKAAANGRAAAIRVDRRWRNA